MEPIDDLKYSKRLRKPKGDITLFSKGVDFIKVPEPPKNSSLDTGSEMLIVQGSTFLLRDSMKKSIRKHDQDPAYAIKQYMDLFGLKYDLNFIQKIYEESGIIIKNIKNSFNRPRPKQLCPYFQIFFDTLPSKTNKTPSYPSGHTTQAFLIAHIYAQKYPEHGKNLFKAAEECGSGRVMAGFHFPSDHKAGIYLAKRLFYYMKKNNDMKYCRIFDL